MTRGFIVFTLAASLWSAEPSRADADRAYAAALVAFEQAEIADTQNDATAAKRQLLAAQQARAEGMKIFNALTAQPDADVVLARRIELDRLGKTCCGRRSIWDRYALKIR